MSARQKLNAASVMGSVVVAALVGSLFQSSQVFVIAAIALVVMCFVGGTIRPRGRNR